MKQENDVPDESFRTVRGVWPQVRAILIALHVLAVLVLALPSPGAGLKREAWKDPTVQGEFRAWSTRLTSMGWETDPVALEERLWGVANDWVRFRAYLTLPFRPYARYLGVRQPWRMFVAPHRFPSRLHLEIEEGGEWRTVYSARSTEFDWRSRQLDHDRMRAAVFRYGWPRYERPYRQFAKWLADRAALEFPDATRFRARMYKYRTATPGEALTGKQPQGVFRRPVVFPLRELR